MPDAKKPKKTIEDVFDEFIDEQEARLSQAGFEKYATVLDLLEAYMERYWPGHDGDREKITKGGGTYCGTYGPEDIAGAFGMFLGYFMATKVICGSVTEKAASTVVRKLAKWLAATGYDPDAADFVD